MKKNILKIISWILLIIWMSIIFMFSNMDNYESNIKSEKTINKVIETTIDTTNKIGITDTHPSNKEINNVAKSLNFPLRKVMHAGIYLILAILIINVLTKYNIKKYKIYILTLMFCIIYSLLDEYHQTFILGRSGQISDCLIDNIGSFLGIGVYIIIFKVKDKIRQKKYN